MSRAVLFYYFLIPLRHLTSSSLISSSGPLPSASPKSLCRAPSCLHPSHPLLCWTTTSCLAPLLSGELVASFVDSMQRAPPPGSVPDSPGPDEVPTAPLCHHAPLCAASSSWSTALTYPGAPCVQRPYSSLDSHCLIDAVPATCWVTPKRHCEGFSFILAPPNYPLAPLSHSPSAESTVKLQPLDETKTNQASKGGRLPAATLAPS